MTHKYLELAFTPAVLAAQQHAYGRAAKPHADGERDALGDAEREFIAARDSFYLGSVNADGWPYIQHRGGAPGFLHVVDERTLAFADLRGNRQLVTTGNVADNARVALFLMDYPQRARLKVWGEARVLDAAAHPEWVARLAPSAGRSPIERVFVIDVHAFDWNCPQHITPRYSEAEVREVIAPLRERIAELERQLAQR